MPETERLLKQVSPISRRGIRQAIEQAIHYQEEQERFQNESLEGGAILGAEGGLRYDLFDHDDPEVEDEQCICDLPEHSQDLLWNDIENG